MLSLSYLFIISILLFGTTQAQSKNQAPRTIKSNITILQFTPKTLHYQPISLTMEEAVAIALKNKPNLQAYKFAIEASKAQGKKAWSAYLPQVSLAGGLDRYSGVNNPQTSANLQADQLVYSFAGPIQKFKMAQKETQKIEFTCDKDKKFIRHEVETAFLECWKLQQQQDAIQALHKTSQSTFEKNEHAHQLKLVNKSDWFKNISEHANNLTTIENYYQDLEINKKKLEFFMGQPIDLALTKLEKPGIEGAHKNTAITTLSLEWSAPKKYSLLPLHKYYAYAQKSRDELKIASKDVEIAQDAAYIANRSNLPEVSVHASTGYYGHEILSPGGTTTAYTFGMKVSWNLFNGLLHDFEAKAAHATMLKEVLNKEQANQTILFEIDQAHNALKQIMTKLKAKKLDLLCAKNNLILSKQQLAIGEISKVEYDAACKEWETKNFEWLGLKTDAAIKSRDLAYACGYPKELS